MVFTTLTLVVGKGGVGRSTIAQGLALAATQRGERATYVQLGVAATSMPQATRPGGGEPAQNGLLTWLALDGTAALEAVAAPLFGSRRIAKSVLNNFAIARLLDVVPALREYALLAAALELAEAGQTVVVDMPATGHGVAWLGVAGRLANLVPSGRTRDQALRLDAALRDPRLTSIVAVTLPEPLVLAETQQLRSIIESELGRDVDHLVINRAPVIPANAIQLAHDLAASDSTITAPAHQLAAWLEQRVLACDNARNVAGGVNLSWVEEYPFTPLPTAIADALASTSPT